MSTMRDEFEAEFAKKGFDIDEDGDGYQDIEMDAAWSGAQWGYLRGLEDAAALADEEANVPREEGGSISRWDACNNVAMAIRKVIAEARKEAARENKGTDASPAKD